MLGRHFLVWSKNDLNVKRHYTIANIMRRHVYDKYVESINEYLESGASSIHPDALNIEPSDELNLSIKTYEKPLGLSTRIHKNNPGEPFAIKGPMGKGLCLKRTGTHIAFSAGTGILVYVDLVAYLVRK